MPPACVISATTWSATLVSVPSPPHGAAEVVDHHRRAATGQFHGVQPAEPAARTGDDGDLSGEVDHGVVCHCVAIDPGLDSGYGGTDIWSTEHDLFDSRTRALAQFRSACGVADTLAASGGSA